MTSAQHPLYGMTADRKRPLRPWPRIAPPDQAPEPKPLVMGPRSETRPAMVRMRTRWQPHAMPTFPIAPAEDPVRRLAATERAGMTLLTLVLCATVSLALLGFGLQILQ